jgi:hypothetical protein
LRYDVDNPDVTSGTLLDSYEVVLVSGDKIRLEVDGSTLKTFLNDVLILTTTDTTYASGSFGVVPCFYTNFGETYSEWDDFIGGDFVIPPAPNKVLKVWPRVLNEPIKTYAALLSAEKKINAGSAPWAAGTHKTLIPAGAIVHNYAVIGISLKLPRVSGTLLDTRHESLFEFLAGVDKASAAAVITIPATWYSDSDVGHDVKKPMVFWLPEPRVITKGYHFGVRVYDSIGTATATIDYGPFKVIYLEQSPAPILATTSATSWAFGSWVEMVPAGAILNDIAVHALSFMIDPVTPSGDENQQTLIELGTGVAGSETTFAQIPLTWYIDNKTGHVQAKAYLPLPEPRLVSARSRIALRVANFRNAAHTLGPFRLMYEELATSSVESQRPSRYDHNALISRLLASRYDHKLLVGRDFTHPFDIRQLVGRDFSHPWDYAMSVGGDFVHPFRIMGSVGRDFSHPFEIGHTGRDWTKKPIVRRSRVVVER